MSGMGGGGAMTRDGTRMAPAPAPGEGAGSCRTTFVVGKITWRRREMRLVERRGNVPAHRAGGAETVH
jgi:hypothetical protein